MSQSRFEKFNIFLVEIQCFRFGRADLPFPGQDRVNMTEFGLELLGCVLKITGLVLNMTVFLLMNT